MPNCAVAGCMRSDGFTGDSVVDFYSFPDSKRFPRLFCSWFKFCDNPFIKLNRKNFICSDHFVEEDYLESDIARKKEHPNLKFYVRLKAGALPSVRSRTLELEPFQAIKEELSDEVQLKDEEMEATELATSSRGISVLEGSDIIDDLLKYPFSSRTEEEKKMIIKTNPPRPDLKNLTFNDSGRIRSFNPEWYMRQPWLAGSHNKNKLFCWSCVLFPSKQSNDMWQQDGFANLKSFSRSLSNHSTSLSHMNSQIEFAMFEKKSSNTDALHMSHSSEVRNNRYVLKQILETIIALPSKNLMMPTENEHCTVNFRDIFEISLRSITAVPYCSFFNDPDFYLHLTTAISDVLKDNLNAELNRTPFFSLQFHNITKTVPQIAITVRFTNQTGVVERYYGIYNITPSELVDFVTTEFSDYSLKVVAQSYDGNFTQGELSLLHNGLKKVFPQALLVHNCAFKLDNIIAQTSFQLFQSKIFFSNLFEIIEFLDDKKDILGLENSSCLSLHDLSFAVKYLLTNQNTIRTKLQEFMLKTNGDYKMVSKATLTFNLLNIFQFIFLMLVYDQIFDKTVVIDNAYLSPVFDIDNVNESLRSLIDVIKTLNMKDGFDSVYRRAKQITKNDGDDEMKFLELYKSILTIVSESLEMRFQDHAKLLFLKSLDIFSCPSKNNDSDKVQSFLNSFYRFYIKSCNIQKLSTEMKVLSSNETFLLSCSSLDDLFNFLLESKLDTTLPEIFSLLSIVLSMPVMPSINVENSLYRRLVEYCSIAQRKYYDNIGCMLFVEFDLLTCLSKNSNFEDSLISKFAQNQGLQSVFCY